MSEPATPESRASPGLFANAWTALWRRIREGAARLGAALKGPELDEDERESDARELREEADKSFIRRNIEGRARAMRNRRRAGWIVGTQDENPLRRSSAMAISGPPKRSRSQCLLVAA